MLLAGENGSAVSRGLKGRIKKEEREHLLSAFLISWAGSNGSLGKDRTNTGAQWPVLTVIWAFVSEIPAKVLGLESRYSWVL